MHLIPGQVREVRSEPHVGVAWGVEWVSERGTRARKWGSDGVEMGVDE